MSLTSRSSLSYSAELSVGVNRTAYVLLFLYISTKPFYLFESGRPQIADLFGCILFLVALLSKRSVPKEFLGILVACAIFSSYTTIISIVQYLFVWDLKTAMAGLFYVFNALMLYAILKLGSKSDEFIKFFMITIVIACLAQIMLSIWSISDVKRQTLFFNNPNQLSYWALLSATMYCVCAKQIGVRVIVQLFAWLVFCFIAALGLSKSAMIALSLLAIIHFFKKVSHALVLIIFAGVVFAAVQGSQMTENVVDRIMGIGDQEDDNIVTRGYDRIIEYPQYLLFGAGEYGLERFPGAVHEIHSTLGTIVFSYGFVGVSIFGMFLWLLYRRVGFGHLLYLLPAFAHGGVHQGLRFTFLWLLFGLLVLTGEKQCSKNGPT